jgi:large subunit ribosomal protein L4
MVALFNNVVLGSWVLALLHEDKNILLSARNIKNIKPIEVSYLNPLDLLKYKEIVFTKDSLEKLNEIYK